MAGRVAGCGATGGGETGATASGDNDAGGEVLVVELELSVVPAAVWALHTGAAALKVKAVTQITADNALKPSRQDTRAHNFSVVGATLSLLLRRNSESLLTHSYFEHKPFADTKHIRIVKRLNQAGNRALPACPPARLPVRVEEVRIAGGAKVRDIDDTEPPLQKLHGVYGTQIRTGLPISQCDKQFTIGNGRRQTFGRFSRGRVAATANGRSDCRNQIPGLAAGAGYKRRDRF